MMFGLPRVITFDQDGEFHNDLDDRLMAMLGIQHRLFTPYHPQVYDNIKCVHTQFYTNHCCLHVINRCRQMDLLSSSTKQSRPCSLSLSIQRRTVGRIILSRVYMPTTHLSMNPPSILLLRLCSPVRVCYR